MQKVLQPVRPRPISSYNRENELPDERVCSEDIAPIFLPEGKVMPYVLCEVVREKPGPLEKTIAVRSIQGHREFLEVPAAFLHHEAGKSYLPVGLVGRDLRQNLALVELPFEADSGANRVWVVASSVLDADPKQVSA